MAIDSYITYNDVELINLSRTERLAASLGIDTVWITEGSLDWIPTVLTVDPDDYNDIANAPWYDEGFAASAEFAGLVPLSVVGLDDSTLTSTPIEYITDGGHSGLPRNETLSIVFNVAIVAQTERGAEFGKRWLDRMLRTTGRQVFCAGATLEYFRYNNQSIGFYDLKNGRGHRNDVRLTRGTSVTRKRSNHCSATWFVTFTMTAADPFEYGHIVLSTLGLGTDPMEPSEEVWSSGVITLVEETCPQYNYTPIYDPLYPALVPAPTPPDFYPAGWDIVPGMTFDRFWARTIPAEPSTSRMVPTIHLSTAFEARMVRVCIWPQDSDVADMCDPLFSVVITYLPAGGTIVIDGEFQAVYFDDGGDMVRRADSLAYTKDANPIEWTAFNDPDGFLVTLDVFSDSSGVEGDGTVGASVYYTPKSD